MTGRIPGDLDRPDKFMAGLTARQLALLTPVGGLIAALGWLGIGRVPLVVLVPGLAVLSGAAISLTFLRQDGMAPETVARAFFAHLKMPRRRVWSPDGRTELPGKLRRLNKRLPRTGRFAEPWRGFHQGDIDLGDHQVRILAVSSLDLQLRSDKETRALTEGFGRLLNALDDSLCVIVRGEPVDLEERAVAAELAGRSGARPIAALAAFGSDHATFLRSISGGLRRQVYLVIRGADAHQLDARGEEVLTLLVPLGLKAIRLEAHAAVALLARSTASPVPDRRSAAPGQAVTHLGGNHASS